jgi:hypothetical protein
MKRYVFIKKTKRHIITTLFLVITVLMLLSFLPYITETVYDEDTTYIYHNFETMKKSENSVLNNLADQINLIMIISWIIIAIGLISFIGLNIDILENHKLTAKILLLTGCSMLFLTILSFISFT